MGPIGSAKSTAMCWELFRRACEQEPWGSDNVRRSRYLIVRNTYKELQDTTWQTWNMWFGAYSRLNQARMVARFTPPKVEGHKVECDLYFRALDRPDHVKNLLSLEIGAAWVNEARELPFTIIEAIDDRIGRYPPAGVTDRATQWRGLLMDTNPPDFESWWYRLCEEDRPSGWQFFIQPGGVLKRHGEWMPNPNAENLENLEDQYYETRMQGKTDDHISVYYGNQYGYTSDGKPVFEDYSDALHVRAGRFDPSLDLIRGWDFGLTPACVFAQQLRSGHVQVLAEMQAKRAGIESFGEDVKRRTLELFPDCEQLLDVGDPSGEFGKDTEQAEHTAFGILHAMGIDMIPQSNDLTMRLGAVRHGLTRIVDGVPLLTIDPTCTLLRKALARDYQLRRKLVGTDRYSEKPEKGPASHIADALQYVCSEAFGYVLGTDGASTEPPERQSTYVDRADSVYAARQQTTYTG